MHLQQDSAFRLFKNSIKSEATRKNWTSYLNRYVDFRQEKQKNELKKYGDLLKGKPKQQKEWLMDYIIFRQEKTRAQSVGVQISAIRHFYWINEYNGLEWDRIRAVLGEPIRAVEDRPYTHAEIARLVAACSPKWRIPIYAEAQGGPRIGAFPKMKLGDLTKKQEGIYRVIVYPRTEAKYITFFGPEATKEIDEYLAYRERMGETLTPESPLLRDDFTEETADKPKPIGKSGIESAIRHAAIKSGMRVPFSKEDMHKRHEVMITHGLRKFFKQWCRRSGIDNIPIEWLVGHKGGEAKIGINKLMMTYDPAQEDELFQLYLKAVDNLTINEENRLKVKLKEAKSERDQYKDMLESRLAEVEKQVQIRDAITKKP